ncbi:hypothetical protein JCM17960_18760 [Magnetospira thiophila]
MGIEPHGLRINGHGGTEIQSGGEIPHMQFDFHDRIVPVVEVVSGLARSGTPLRHFVSPAGKHPPKTELTY